MKLLELITHILIHTKNIAHLKTLLERLFQNRLALKCATYTGTCTEGANKQKEALFQSQRIMVYIIYSLFSNQVQWMVTPQGEFLYSAGNESTWMDHVTFTLDVLLGWVDALHTKEVTVQRKKSTKIQ
jgi:hypothetical protein